MKIVWNKSKEQPNIQLQFTKKENHSLLKLDHLKKIKKQIKLIHLNKLLIAT